MRKVVAPTRGNQAMMHSVFDFVAEVSIVDCRVCPVESLCGSVALLLCEHVSRLLNVI